MKKNDRITTLFIENDEMLAIQYEDYLLQAGFDVFYTNSVEEALSVAAEKPFEVVIIDIMMNSEGVYGERESGGGVNTGKILARDLREILPNTKIVALTNHTDAHIERLFSLDDSMAFFRKKDTPPEMFPKLLRRALRKSDEPPTSFIVHGHDHDAVSGIIDFLGEELGWPAPVVLKDSPSKGRTICEKFEEYADDAELVFVLVTPDDFGFLAADNTQKEERARQNIIFELGYFYGLFGRKSGKVLLLQKGSTTLPSDLDGIVRIDISKGLASKEVRNNIRLELKDWID